MDAIWVLLVGVLVSFLGQLPLGNMNFTATQLSVQESISKAWQYGWGIALVEVIYLRIALTGMHWIIQHQQIFMLMGWITVVVFMTLGLLSIQTAYKQVAEKKALLLNNNMPRFFLGMSISAVNPAQIPFWLIWTSYLLKNNLLKASNWDYNWFTLGAGLGTLIGLAVYIYGGNWAIKKMKTSSKTLNIVMGVIFILTASIQLYKMISSPSLILRP